MDGKIDSAIVTQQNDFVKLKDTLVNERTGVMDQLSYKIDLNSTNINHLLEEKETTKRKYRPPGQAN